MAKSTPSVIYLRSVNRDGTHSFDEAQAGGTITPGDWVELDLSTTPPTATAVDGTPTYGPLHIALEKEYDDDNTKDAIDATYASGEQLRYVSPARGDHVYVRAAVGESIAKGAYCINAGATTAGCFSTSGAIDATTVVETLKGVCLDTVTGGAAVVRFRMEVI